MQIVIDIPKEQYSLIMQSHRSGVERFIDKEAMMYVIKNGTPLPKGHGRMGDIDELYNRISGFIKQHKRLFENTMVFMEHILDGIKSTETIIEADKEN